MVTDPVCGAEVNPVETEIQSEKDGDMYYFCSIDCRESFEEDPDRYLS